MQWKSSFGLQVMLQKSLGGFRLSEYSDVMQFICNLLLTRFSLNYPVQYKDENMLFYWSCSCNLNSFYLCGNRLHDPEDVLWYLALGHQQGILWVFWQMGWSLWSVHGYGKSKSAQNRLESGEFGLHSKPLTLCNVTDAISEWYIFAENWIVTRGFF